MFCSKHETTATEESRTNFWLTLFFDRENNHVNVHNPVPTHIPKLQLGRSGNKGYSYTIFCILYSLVDSPAIHSGCIPAVWGC